MLNNEEVKTVKLYGVIRNNSIYFSSEEELNKYLKEKDLAKDDVTISVIEYIGDFKGKNDVVKEQLDNQEPCLYSIVDSNTFVYYSDNDWVTEQGDISEIYDALKVQGIPLKDNVHTSQYVNK